MNIKEQINFKQPKYVIPALIYIPVLFTGYFAIDMFNTEPVEINDKNLETTEYLNSNIPDAKLKSNDIGSKYDSMLESYGKIEDYSAVDNVEQEDPEEGKEEYSTKYSDKEIEMMEENERLKAQLAEKEARQKSSSNPQSSRNTDKAMEELNRAIAQARLQGQGSYGRSFETSKGMDANAPSSSDIKQPSKSNHTKSKDKSKEDDDDVEVVKKVQTNSNYFNTITVADPEPNLIKAIIDENVKASDGTRVRLRLLDEIEIGETIVPKGTYLYVTMSGFGSQRVKGEIKSILVGGDISKVDLSIYDMDGLEGLYVPKSSLRETAKDVGSGALSGNSISNNTSSENSMTQWGMQAVQNAYTKTTNAVSKAIKKNTVTLKYGTFVYLVNSKSNKNK